MPDEVRAVLVVIGVISVGLIVGTVIGILAHLDLERQRRRK
jgi:hypothetical protein